MAYILQWGSIPEGAVIRHTCDESFCVNPLHLVSGSQKENMQDKVNRGRHHNQKTHCHNGHEFTEENTYVYPSTELRNPQRHCKACRRAADRRRRGSNGECEG